jgi:hypothetical protein
MQLNRKINGTIIQTKFLLQESKNIIIRKYLSRCPVKRWETLVQLSVWYWCDAKRTQRTVESSILILWAEWYQPWTAAKQGTKPVDSNKTRHRTCKAIAIQAWTGPEGSRRHMMVVRLSALRTDRLYHPGKHSWYSFLLDESIPEPKCGRKAYVNGKSQWPHRESNPQPPGLVALCLNRLRHRVTSFTVITDSHRAYDSQYAYKTSQKPLVHQNP